MIAALRIERRALVRMVFACVLAFTSGCLSPAEAPVAPSTAKASPPVPAALARSLSTPWSGPDAHDARSEVMVFLLLGQSNMEGAPKAAPGDEVEDRRVVVLAYDDCPNLGRTYDAWYLAKPPLHSCRGGVGPGDWFGKAMAKAYPNATIALVPVAISGADIDLFRKGVVSARRHEFRIPPDDHWAGAYDWVLERARLAARVGPLRGILFHQGESDTGRAEWVDKVRELVADLRSDLGVGEIPFVAGELLYSGCCGRWHNPLVQRLPAVISNTGVVSANALSGIDAAHFDLPGQRELGVRYATAMIDLLRAGGGSASAGSR